MSSASKQPGQKLSRQDLQAIQGRNPRQAGNPQSDDLYAALWEIKRLRAVVLRADQLQRVLGEIGRPGGGAGVILDVLRAELADEPCVTEQVFLPELSAGPRAQQNLKP